MDEEKRKDSAQQSEAGRRETAPEDGGTPQPDETAQANEAAQQNETPRRNDEELFRALNRAKKKKRARRLITVLVILAIVVSGLMVAVRSLRKRVEASLAEQGDEVLHCDAAYGSISTRVSGSGTIEDVDTEEVTIPEGVEVDEVLVRSNDKLRRGDPIATLDLTSILTAMAAAQEELDELDKELASSGGDRVDMNVTAGVSGRVKKIYAQTDTDVAACMVEHGALALLSLDGKMAVEFENDSLNAGDGVKVERANGSVLDGVVEKRVGDTATVLVTDNGPEPEEAVRILSTDGELLGAGSLAIHSEFRVTGFTGTVSKVTFGENMQVNAASILFNLTDTGYSAHYNSVLKQRKEKEKTLLELLGLYQGGALRAPFDGSVQRIDYDEDAGASAASASASTSASAQSGAGAYAYGMSSAAGGSAQTAAATGAASDGLKRNEDGIVIVTMSPDVSMRVKIDVDERDILSLERGQAAEITIESVGKEVFNGIVTEVDRTANSSAGVTTYSAEITFDKARGMLTGMTGDVIINIQGNENVLIVPADAVHRTSAGAYVYTSYDTETKQYGGIVPVEIGISNDDYSEIRSGLEEGTTVYYTEKKEDDFFMMMGGPGMNGRTNGAYRR